ncbi:putative replication protein [Lactobacillus phage Lc-Nu]|uniref:Replication protein n=1 Tax=Lactobacillus phage Lc-Nu TaxID=146269 RepID=A8YQM0_9CAUD|nr:DnaD-like helicase loader [Lactobacillus phage Lc-Nu]AAR04658.1 putative replication protein [Lactobacillus phage Lc-Nu]
MPQQGWIKLHRKVCNSFVWTNSDQLKLWLLILMKASHDDHRFLFNGKQVDVSNGQLVTGRDALAFEFNDGVSRDHRVVARTLWRWVKQFEKEQMLSIKSNTQYSVITVINYGLYQESDHQVSIDCPSSVHQVSTYKNLKNEENINTRAASTLESDFEKLWKLYPKKIGKKPALAAYKRAMSRKKNPATNKQIQDGIVAYRQLINSKGTEKRFVKDGSTFFNQESWNDYLEVVKEERDEQEARKPKFDPKKTAIAMYIDYNSPDRVLEEIQAQGIPIDPEDAKRYIAEYDEGRKQA